MTPAVTVVKQKKIDFHIHEYQHNPSAASYGLEASEKLGVAVEKVFKTLVIIDDQGKLAVAILPVNNTLNLKKIAKAIKSKKAKMATPDIVERSTGYVLGGVSPLGQKKSLTTVIDISAQTQDTIYISAGKRGLEIELNPQDLAQITQAVFIDIVLN